MSVRIGVERSTRMMATTVLGSSSSRRSDATSPTLMPLNSTAEPVVRPVTGPEKTTRMLARAACSPAFVSQKRKPSPAAIMTSTNRPIAA